MQIDALTANLRDLTETVQALPGRAVSVQRTMMLKHMRGGNDNLDSSLARSHADCYGGYHGLWTVISETFGRC